MVRVKRQNTEVDDAQPNKTQNPELRNLTVVILNDWFNWTPIWMFSQVTHLKLRFFKPSYFSFVRAMAILKAFPILRVFRLIMNCTEDLKEETEGGHDLSYKLDRRNILDVQTSEEITFGSFSL
ncbi:uncharacterized protein [Euphorbia lathyris]|uniref:uncharacterized protein isoform X4 n=1 Tax=Euphorbia lathyris TaxID=212925 RepID=UPI003313E0DE